jgi:hypothetical protein
LSPCTPAQQGNDSSLSIDCVIGNRKLEIHHPAPKRAYKNAEKNHGASLFTTPCAGRIHHMGINREQQWLRLLMTNPVNRHRSQHPTGRPTVWPVSPENRPLGGCLDGALFNLTAAAMGASCMVQGAHKRLIISV